MEERPYGNNMKSLLENYILPQIFYLLFIFFIASLICCAIEGEDKEKCYKVLGSKCVEEVCDIYIKPNDRYEKIRVYEKTWYGDQFCRREI